MRVVLQRVKEAKVTVEGQVTGDIVAMESAVITRTGRVLGDITAPRVTLEDGGVFKGRIDMQASDEKLEPAAAPRKFLSAGNKSGDGAHQKAAEKKAQSGK